jgi:flagellar basal body-associated protein FliL
MNPRFIFLIVVLLIIAAGVVYVLYFMPKSDETTVKGPFVLTGKSSEQDSVGSTMKSILTQVQLSKALKSNFGLQIA